MSEQVTRSSEKATEAQVATITKQGARLFKGTASSAIDILGNYPLLNAYGRGDLESFIAEGTKALAKQSGEREAYKASHPQASLPTTIPAE